MANSCDSFEFDSEDSSSSDCSNAACKSGSCEPSSPFPATQEIDPGSRKRKAGLRDIRFDTSRIAYGIFVDHAFQLASKFLNESPIRIHQRILGNLARGQEDGKLTLVRYDDILEAMERRCYEDEAEHVKSKNSSRWRKTLLMDDLLADRELDLMNIIKPKLDSDLSYVSDVQISDGVFIVINHLS